MKTHRLRSSLVMVATGLVLMNTVWASTPVWTFAPVSGYPASVSISPSGTATIKYTVTNQSHKPHTLQMKPIQGIASSGCVSHLGSHQSCTLTLTVHGSGLKGDVLGGPILCEQSNPNQCYQPSQANSLAIRLTPDTATLTPSISTLGLSVSGSPRKITITNHGSAEAANVVVSSSGLPSDASVSPSSCGTIAANGGICEITVTPGATASANASNAPCTTGVQPEGSVSVTADGGLSTSVNAYVLSYGCIYQGGFIYSVDDTTADTGSIGGKVVSLEDQAPRYNGSVIWSSNGTDGTSANVVYDSIWSIALGSTDSSPLPNETTPASYPATLITGQSNCNGSYDGACNSNNILVYYSTPNTSPAITLSYYAAGRCKDYTGGGFSDWYLPAICEMGPASGSSGCSVGTPNIVGNLGLLLGDPNNNPDTSCSYGTNCLAGYYWSSTEASGNPRNNAWYEYFASGGSSGQATFAKYVQLSVRCSRALTL